jgi:hypothetical protein
MKWVPSASSRLHELKDTFLPCQTLSLCTLQSGLLGSGFHSFHIQTCIYTRCIVASISYLHTTAASLPASLHYISYADYSPPPASPQSDVKSRLHVWGVRATGASSRHTSRLRCEPARPPLAFIYLPVSLASLHTLAHPPPSLNQIEIMASTNGSALLNGALNSATNGVAHRTPVSADESSKERKQIINDQKEFTFVRFLSMSGAMSRAKGLRADPT